MRKVGIVAAVLGILTLSLNATAVPPAPAPSPTIAPPLAPLPIDRIARLESNVAAHATRIAALEKGAAVDAAKIAALETKLADIAEKEKNQWKLAHATIQHQHEACMYTCVPACVAEKGPATTPVTKAVITEGCSKFCGEKC
jgi:hypothetical protein